MIYVTTATQAIFELTGRKLIESFLATQPDTDHLVFFFEDSEDVYRDSLPRWIPDDMFDKPNLHFVNIMTYEYQGSRLVDAVESKLSGLIDFTDEYSSPRSLKWFRPVAAILYASELFPERQFCSIDADCLFTATVPSSLYEDILTPYNVCYLGRKHFNVIQHGTWSGSDYVKTGEAAATDKDTHTETGFIGFNCEIPSTRDFIIENVNWWLSGRILDLKYKTDCHTFDATVDSMPNLKYNNLLSKLGVVSPIGSRVLEASPVGKYMLHNKGTLGPQLYTKNLI